MGFGNRWLRKPQGTWLRKALFQVHLWSGLILGLYIVVVCASGSAIMYRNELYDVLQKRLTVEVQPHMLTRDELEQAVHRAYPDYRIAGIRKGRDTDEATEVALSRGWWGTTRRLFDPYSGRDLGPSVDIWFRILRWCGELHGSLLLGQDVGMTINAILGALTAGVALTGLIIWWPGIGRIARALTFRTGVPWRKLTFDLHSAVGFWTFAVIFMWGATGAYFVFPQPFRTVIEWFTPINPPPLPPAPFVSGLNSKQTPPQGYSKSGNVPGAAGVTQGFGRMTPRRPRRPPTKGQLILRGFSNAHYGTFGGWPVRALWILLGFAPAILYVTALVMWWNRVLSPALRRARPRLEPVPEYDLSKK